MPRTDTPRENPVMTRIEAAPVELRAETPPAYPPRNDVPLVKAILERSAQENEFYLRYRRPLLQVLLHRRIAIDAAEDLLQRVFARAITKLRTEGLTDPSNLGGYLYQTTCNMVSMYWRGELAREHDSSPELLRRLQDQAPSLEERLDQQQRADCVRELMEQLPQSRDREVLERYYLNEEPRSSIRDSLKLTDMQFNTVLWRARQRFGEILRHHGLGAGGAELAS